MPQSPEHLRKPLNIRGVSELEQANIPAEETRNSQTPGRRLIMQTHAAIVSRPSHAQAKLNCARLCWMSLSTTLSLVQTKHSHCVRGPMSFVQSAFSNNRIKAIKAVEKFKMALCMKTTSLESAQNKSNVKIHIKNVFLCNINCTIEPRCVLLFGWSVHGYKKPPRDLIRLTHTHNSLTSLEEQ